ncbi:MAG: MBL fold metallo-hydrolase [Planctomycetota bacterium]|nr:MBL fold metallo-hydrolase [Planctomycetota bacterium]
MLPSTVGGDGPAQLLSSYLIDGSICIDAGSIGFHTSLEMQLGVKHLFITHSHSDHVASLPTFLDVQLGVGDPERAPITIYATEVTAENIRRDILNDRHWPDFLRICEELGQDLMRLEIIRPGVPVEVEGKRITAVPVDHVVETMAYIIEDESSACAIVTDTGPTTEIWQRCHELQGLSTVILELAFPRRLQWLADASKHLTPDTFQTERQKAPDPDQLRMLAVHLKANQYDEIVSELEELSLPGVEVMKSGIDYQV